MSDAVQPDLPEQEGLAEPELPEVDIEGARLLANEARGRLHADGFDDLAVGALYADSPGGGAENAGAGEFHVQRAFCEWRDLHGGVVPVIRPAVLAHSEPFRSRCGSQRQSAGLHGIGE